MRDSLVLQMLNQAATDASREEEQFRQSFNDELKRVERSRIFAHRRLHLMQAIFTALNKEENAELAAQKGRTSFMIEMGFDAHNEAHSAIADAFMPVIVALDEVANMEGEIDEHAPLRELTAFEGWYAQEKGQSFLALMDVYRPETQLVDF